MPQPATFLSSLSTETAAPLMSIILLVLGLYVLIRFTAVGLPKAQLGKPLRKRFLVPLGVVAGFVDSTGGGGWRPVGTPAILASGRLEPRKTIGSIDTSEDAQQVRSFLAGPLVFESRAQLAELAAAAGIADPARPSTGACCSTPAFAKTAR